MKNDMTRLLGFRVAGTLIGLVLCSGIMNSQTGSESSSGTDWLSGSLSLTSSYNDNLFDYAPGDVVQFHQDLRPDKFSMDRPTDLITTFRTRLVLSPAVFEKNPTQIRFRFNQSSHLSNPLRNYLTAGVEARQYFLRKNYVFIGYGLLPRYYLRNISFRNLSLPRSVWLNYAEARLSRQTFTIGFGRNITSRITASIDYAYAFTRYNQELAERDSRAHELDLDGSVRIFSWLRLDAGYHFDQSMARGRELSDTLSDLSSRAHRFDLGSDLYLRGLTGIPLTIHTDVVFEEQRYLTDKNFDPVTARFGDKFHYGRLDHLWRMESEIRLDVLEVLEVYAQYTWEQNRTNLAETADAGSYQAHVVGLGVEYSF